MRRDLLLLAAAVLLIRLPFLDQPVQGDDVYYLLFARNAQADPLHPMQMGFRLQGEVVWAAGHTRPPLNAYFLAALYWLFGGVEETAFHAVYLLFSWIAAGAMYFLARRFAIPALPASFVFLSAPAFVINGTKLEADLPLLAFWMAGFALFAYGRLLLAAAAMALAGLCAYQSVFATPILAYWAWRRRQYRQPLTGLVVFSAPLAIAAWQLWERAASGTAPAAVLAGYFETYGLLELERKLRSAAALTAHLGWIASPALVFAAWGRRGLGWTAAVLVGIPVSLLAFEYSFAEKALLTASLASGALVLVWAGFFCWRRREEREGLWAAWLLVFHAGALAVFYAGSARYLLPLAAPLVLLLLQRLPSRRLVAVCTAIQLLLGLALARAEYHANSEYRAAAKEIAPLASNRRLWTNAEWGLRYYLEGLGGEPLLKDQTVYPGSLVVESDLAGSIPYRAEGTRKVLLEREISSGTMPFRLTGRGSRSGYSSSEFGVLPFGLGGGAIDRVTVYAIGLPEPTAGFFTLNSPEAGEHLLAGFYPPEGQPWRWMGGEGVALLRVPEGARVFRLEFHIPDGMPARELAVEIDGRQVAQQRFDSTGSHVLEAPVELPAGEAARVHIRVDQTRAPPGDGRELGVVVSALGFR